MKCKINSPNKRRGCWIAGLMNCINIALTGAAAPAPLQRAGSPGALQQTIIRAQSGRVCEICLRIQIDIKKFSVPYTHYLQCLHHSYLLIVFSCIFRLRRYWRVLDLERFLVRFFPIILAGLFFQRGVDKRYRKSWYHQNKAGAG